MPEDEVETGQDVETAKAEQQPVEEPVKEEVVKEEAVEEPVKEEAVKEEPVELGDEAYKNVWPKAIWPADIPNQTPLALRTQLVGHVLLDSDEEVTQDFRMPNNLWLLAGGTIGEKFSYFLHTHAFSEGEGEFTVARVFLQYNDALDGLSPTLRLP